MSRPKRPFSWLNAFISFTVSLFVIAQFSVALAQHVRTKPYIGGSFSIAKSFGIGIEFGFRNPSFYVGLEYGIYNINVNVPNTGQSGVNGGLVADRPVKEDYFGFHVGAYIGDVLGVGAVLLWNTTIPFAFNIGPDLHLHTSDHVSFNLAYTVRRGVKVGACYQF